MYLCREVNSISLDSDLLSKKDFDLNELIVRLAVIAVCIIGIAAAAAFIIIGLKDGETENEYAEVVNVTTFTEESVTELTETASAETSYEFDIADVTDAPEVTTVPEETGENGETSSSRTVITSRARKEYDNHSVYIDMESVLQLPELPVGCEITALTINLRYLGFDAEKTDLAANYLPKGGNAQYIDGELYKDSFFDYFIGDPFSRGYGCFSNAIVTAAEKYIADNGGGYTVVNLSGSSPDVLYDYLAEGIPVICWATDGMIEPEYYESWFDNATGEKLDWYLNEHCFVLAGFNMDADTVTLNDPMKGIIDYNINKFETRYAQMYSQAIVILKDEDSGETASSEQETEETEQTETTDLTEEPSFDTEE